MHHFLPRIVLSALALWLSVSLHAQQPADTLPELSLEQLLQLRALDSSSVTEAELSARIEAASQRPFSTRETPNVVTVITADEIRNSGARDLMDVLRLVPGIEFGVDVEGVVSIGIRGQWGAEGKVLVTVDGVEMNEMMYGFFTFGNDFEVSSIKRVEVVRGPGSVVNGGFASLGVINIITRDVSAPDGVRVTSSVGMTQTGISRSNAGFTINTHSADGWHVNLRAGVGNALRSDQRYNDFFGNSYNMRSASDINRIDAGVNITGHGLAISLIYRDHSMQTLVPFDSIFDTMNYVTRFLQYRAAMVWSNKGKRGWSSQVGLYINKDKPWNSGVIYQSTPAYQRQGLRTRLNTGFGYSFNNQTSLNFGWQAFIDQAEALDSLNRFRINDSTNFVLKNQSLYTEFIWKTYWFNVMLGGRAEYNSAYGAAFVPRLAITKNFERLSFKLLYNESFRAPTIENLDWPDSYLQLSPEFIKVTEFELGYKLSRKAYFNTNVFRTDIINKIVYTFDSITGSEYYTNNAGRNISYGAEAEFIYRGAINQLRVNWSWYTVDSDYNAEFFAVPDKENVMLNFPQHKISASGTHVFPSGLTANITAHLVSERFLFSSIDSAGDYVLGRCAPDMLLSASVSKTNILPGLDVFLTIHNLFNRPYVIGMPYQGGIGAFPSLSREAVLRLTWHPQFNKTHHTN